MTLPQALPEGFNHQNTQSADEGRPTKRVRFDDDSALQKDLGTKDSASLVRRHPLGVRPSGNALTSPVNLKQACRSFSLLPDELLVQLLEILDAKDLLRLGSTCRALHAFTRNEELWRALFVE